MITILFVCTGNTCRSPMASALLIKKCEEFNSVLQPGQVQVASAGLYTDDDLPASMAAIEVMRGEGIDISLHRSSYLRAIHIRAADLILTMTASQRDEILNRYPYKSEHIYTLGDFTGVDEGEILDPYGQDLETYQRCLSQLKLLVDRLMDKIIELRCNY